jgi:hypothetical protein
MNQFATTGKPMDLDKFFIYCAFDVFGDVFFNKRSFGIIEQRVDTADAISTSVVLNMLLAWRGFSRCVFLYLLDEPICNIVECSPQDMKRNAIYRANTLSQQRDVQATTTSEVVLLTCFSLARDYIIDDYV